MSEKEREREDKAQTETSERSCCGPGRMPEMMQGCCPDGMPSTMQSVNRDQMLKMMRKFCPDGADACDCETLMQKMLEGKSDKPDGQ